MRFTEVKTEPVLTLPANTILFRSEGPQVGIVQEGGNVEVCTVKLGRDFGQTIEVLSGLDAKDRVILNPTESLVSGCTVPINETNRTEEGLRRCPAVAYTLWRSSAVFLPSRC